jgi:dimeric dUTPase (all-alpha-NTP-PPase superfamily)
MGYLTGHSDVVPLWEMLEQQERFQRRLLGAAPKDLTPHDRAAYVREMKVALDDELHEALGEIAWKSWASTTHFNRDAYVSELIDAWHFYMNLLLVADVSAEEFGERYMEKLRKNHARQDDGYDGVSTKCPRCKRDVTDSGVDCVLPKQGSVPGYCAVVDDLVR